MKLSAKKEDEVLKYAQKKIEQWYEYFNTNITSYRSDLYFLYLDQWDTRDRENLKILGKPNLTFNKLIDPVNKIVGQYRSFTPQLQVRYTGDQEEIKNVDLHEQLLRTIAYQSKSDIVYQTALSNAISGGFGAMRVTHKYEGDNSFNQKICIEPVEDSTQVFFDPNARDVTKSDGMFCGRYVRHTKDEFSELYPDIPHPQSFPENSYYNSSYFSWFTDNYITVAEIYKREYTTFTAVQLEDGSTLPLSEYNEMAKHYEESMAEYELKMLNDQQEGGGSVPDPSEPAPTPLPQIAQRRKSQRIKIMKYRLIAGKVIEAEEFPSQYLPIVFVDGNSQVIDGRQYTLSYIRYARDAQKFLNYCASETGYYIQNMRREQFMGTPDNVKGHEKIWQQPELQQGILLYTPDAYGNKPEKLPVSQIPPQLMESYQRTENDIKTILGVFDANLGAGGGEKSGVAYANLIRQGNAAPSVFLDNNNRAIEQIGRIILDMAPNIYDSERNITLTLPDGSQKSQKINSYDMGGNPINHISSDDFEVVVKPGASFEVQKMEEYQSLMSLISINSDVFPLVADLVANSIDVPERAQIVTRLKKGLVPPGLLAEEEGKPAPQPPPQPPNPEQMRVQYEMKKMQMDSQQMQMKQEIAQKEFSLKQHTLEIEEEKNKLKEMQIHADFAETQMKTQAEMGKAQWDYKQNMTKTLIHPSYKTNA